MNTLYTVPMLLGSGFLVITGLSGCGALCEKRAQETFGFDDETVDLNLIDMAYYEKCKSSSTEACENSDFALAGMVNTEGIENLLSCEDICAYAMDDYPTSIDFCEINIDWEAVPAEYQRYDFTSDTGESDSGESGVNYFGRDWSESFGTVSCNGIAIEQSDCWIWD